MAGLVYEGIFQKDGQEVFRSQMIAGYTMVITGARFQVGSSNEEGYAIERNTRYADHVGGFKEMLGYLLGGRQLNGWSLRKVRRDERA